MRRSLVLCSLVALFLLPASPVQPCPVGLCGSSMCLWHSFMDEVELRGLPGVPYWDGNSWDTLSRADNPALPVNPANALSLLEGHTSVTPSGQVLTLGADAPGLVDFWAHPNLNADPAVKFLHHEGPAGYEVRMLTEVTALPYNNEFGWYSVADPGNLHPVFLGADGPGKTWTGVMAGEFGLYYRDAARGITFRTDSAGSVQQFAIFRMGTRIYVGIEDLIGLYPVESDYDFNDMIVTFDQVPEPALLLVMGVGLVACAWVSSRRGRRA